MNKDWNGNRTSLYSTIGARYRDMDERETNDFYATEPIAIDRLIEVEGLPLNVWECACGEGHLSKRLEEHGYIVKSTDLIDRGYGEVLDFLSATDKWDGAIVTNPPYKYATEFIRKALDLVTDGSKVCMFLKIQFLESGERREFFKEYPPKTVYVCSKRIKCAKNGRFDIYKTSAVCFAWYVWKKGYKGNTTLKWIN